jgi:hypothetical protein
MAPAGGAAYLRPMLGASYRDRTIRNVILLVCGLLLGFWGHFGFGLVFVALAGVMQWVAYSQKKARDAPVRSQKAPSGRDDFEENARGVGKRFRTFLSARRRGFRREGGDSRTRP